MGAREFEYHEAFSRNIGWISKQEEYVLSHKCVAIAGMGGAGGIHLLTLIRMGLQHFKISDLDDFEVANFNRQVGATMSTVGRSKVDVLREMALDINPNVTIEVFPDGINEGNVTEFLEGVDVYVDGVDFFVFDARQLIFQRCRQMAIPAVTAAPLGFSTALLVFTDDSMSFDDYFNLGDSDVNDRAKAVRLMTGLAPAGLHGPALIDPDAMCLEEKRGPSTFIGCELVAAFACTAAIKIMLNRGPLLKAPKSLQCDVFSNRFVKVNRPLGFHNPLQRLLRFFGFISTMK